MTTQEYQKQAERTLAKCETSLLDDFHMITGMQTEAAEIADVYKKHIAYGKPLDMVNVKEELGDLLWYIANMCNLHDWDMSDIMRVNIEKLKARYPEKFTNENALNRNLDAEREILEQVQVCEECKRKPATTKYSNLKVCETCSTSLNNYFDEEYR